MKKIVFSALTLLLFIATVAQDVHHIADSVRIRRRVPGLVYAVLNSDKVLLSGAVGFKQLRGKDSISVANRFHLGNATASLTAFIAAQMVARGKIVWTTKLIQELPLLAKKCRPEYKSVTLADLLSQQAGFPGFNLYADFANLPAHSGTLQVQRYKLVEWLVLQPSRIDTSVKRTARFSNANTAVAVAMLEKAAGKSWEELLQEYINKPLGISVKTRWPNKISPTEPWGHWEEGDRFTPLDPNHWFNIPPTFTGAAV
jgi:D-alanyl-D-alanine carboxypeptidase